MGGGVFIGTIHLTLLVLKMWAQISTPWGGMQTLEHQHRLPESETLKVGRNNLCF